MKMVLLAHGPAWGAPSLDAECTKASAWLRFCRLREGVDFTIEACNNPHVGLSGYLPVLQVDGGINGRPRLAEPHEIFSCLAALGYDPDAGLSHTQRADSLAYTALIEERLQVALLFSLWEDEANYEAVIRPQLAATLAVPLCFYLPWSMRRRVHSQLARRRCLDGEVAYGMGESAIDALSVRLGERPFFHGSSPTGVDASAFGYLTAVLRCPLPHDRLRSALRARPNLVRFCERIAAEHFGPPPPLLPPVAAPAPRRISMDTRAQAESAASTTDAAAPAASAAVGKEARTPKQANFRRRSRNAVLTSVGAAVMYALAVDTFGREPEPEDSEEE